MWYLLFFFFKQKTAYEMRISDWSSDVCSSDLLLLEARLVRLVDDDDAQLRIGQEKRRARTDDDLRIPAGDGMPRAAALGRTEATVPRDGLAAEARRKAGEHRLGQRDFGEQDERLLARFDRGGGRLTIDLGRSEEHTADYTQPMRITYA